MKKIKIEKKKKPGVFMKRGVGNAKLIRSSLFWSAVVLRTEISRNNRSSPDFREGEGIIFLQERGYCSTESS